MERSETVEEYILNNENWRDAILLLRDIFHSTELDESIKWGVPVYSFKSKNVAGIAAFRSHIAIWFYQGALLKDRQKKLINAQKGVTRALRQWRFTSTEEVLGNMKIIKDYLEEAITNQKQGKAVLPLKEKSLVIPDELKGGLIADPVLRSSFENFTLFKKREFAEYVGEPKLSETRQKRLQKIIPMILNGTGLNDRYRK